MPADLTVTVYQWPPSETQLAEHRDNMTLLERVQRRQYLDQQAGISYPPPTVDVASGLAHLLTAPTA